MREIQLRLEHSLDFFKHISLGLIKISLWFLLLMSLARLAFLFKYGPLEQIFHFKGDLFHALWLGVRYDFSIVCYLQILPILILMVLVGFRREKLFEVFLRVIPIYFVVVFGLVSVIIGIDFNYFSYFQDHLSILVFDFFTDDTWALLKTFWHNYPIIWILLGFSVYFWLLYKLLFRIMNRKRFEMAYSLPVTFQQIIAKLVVVLLVPAIATCGARGTLSTFPLGLMDAVISSNDFINKISLNGVITVQRAFKEKFHEMSNQSDNISFFGYDEDVRNAFVDYFGTAKSSVNTDFIENLAQVSKADVKQDTKLPHVVVLVMESLGSYWIRFQSSDFNVMGALEPHFHEDIYLPNFISATGGTLGSITTIATNLPRQVYGPYLSESDFLKIQLKTSAVLPFKEKGYQTRFIYGGSTGWRNLNRFLPVQGFDLIEGENIILENVNAHGEATRHSWGVYDEYWLDYIFKVLSEANQPQFILGLSTTNHPPYTLPEHYQKLPLKFPDELEKRFVGNIDLVHQHFETYQYANHVLGLFLKRLKDSPLKDNTLVVITGDHHFNVMNYSDRELLDREMVPFYLYAPEAWRPKNVDKEVFGSHLDIVPTLYNLVLPNQKYYAMGSDLFASEGRHIAYNNSMMIFSKAGAALVRDKDTAQYMVWDENKSRELKLDDGNINVHHLADQYRASQAVVEQVLRSERARFKANHSRQ